MESVRTSMLMPASGPAFSSTSSTAQPATPAAGDRANAQAIFAAKTPRPAAGAPSKAPLFVGAAVIVALVIAGGAYVWLQLNAINTPRQASPARPSAPPPVTSSSVIRNVTPITSLPAPSEPPAPLMPPAAPVPPPASGVAPGSPPRARSEAAAAGPYRAPAPVNNADTAVARLLQENAQRSTAPPGPVRLAKSVEQPRIANDVSSGYEWLVRGDLQAARRSYLSALAADPNSIDALLGLATIEARTGERAAAARSYRRVLTADPRNTAALAGLAAVSDYSRPEALESSLQADIQRYPNSAPLRVALANLYASQLRWTEAQSVYFEAHRLEPDNPDVLFNLAVALDNLKQPRLAAEYYGRALAQANGRTVQFDTRVAERRAADLRR
jgi:Tfp pilus assembly protein PilF